MRPGENRGAWKECLALLPPGPDAVHTLPPPRPVDGTNGFLRTNKRFAGPLPQRGPATSPSPRRPTRERRERMDPDLVEGRSLRCGSERHSADRRRSVEVLELAPEAGEAHPPRVVVLDLMNRRGYSGALTGHDVRGWRKVESGQDCGHLRRHAQRVELMQPRREVIRVRAERDVHDLMRSVGPVGVRPRAPLTQAVLTVADEQRLLVLGEDDVHDLPVALVRLPERAGRREWVRVDVVVVEVPVLQHDPVAVMHDAPVDGRPAASLGPRRAVACETAERRRGRAGVLVQPEITTRGQIAGLGIRVDK